MSFRSASRFSTVRFWLTTARDAQPRMDTPAAGCSDDLLAEFADEDCPLANFREGFNYADDVALRDRRLEPEQEVRRSQVEEIQSVRLQNLAVMHQSPHLFRRRRQLVHASDSIHRLAGAEMMAHPDRCRTGRWTMTGTSQYSRPWMNRSKPRNSTMWNRACSTSPASLSLM